MPLMSSALTSRVDLVTRTSALKNWSMRVWEGQQNLVILFFLGSFLSLLVLHHPQYWTIPMFEVNAGCMLMLQNHPCPTKICTKIGSAFWNTPRKSKELWSQRQMFIPLSLLTLSISGFPTVKEVAVKLHLGTGHPHGFLPLGHSYDSYENKAFLKCQVNHWHPKDWTDITCHLSWPGRQIYRFLDPSDPSDPSAKKQWLQPLRPLSFHPRCHRTCWAPKQPTKGIETLRSWQWEINGRWISLQKKATMWKPSASLIRVANGLQSNGINRTPKRRSDRNDATDS